MRRHPRTVAILAALAAVTVTAEAQAASYTVRARGGACGGADTTCGSLAGAAKAMRSGDAVTIAPGRYEESPRFEAPGIAVRGSRRAPGVVIEGTVTFAGSGGRASVLQRLAVSATAPGAAAVAVSGSAGVSVRDASLFSASAAALAISGAAGSAVTRSRLLAGTSAVALGGGALKLDSSVLGGGAGASGAGIEVLPAPQYAFVPPASIVARHVTIAGAPAALALPAGAAGAAARITDSIVLGAAPAGVAFTRTDRTSDPVALFVNPRTRNFRLRPGSPALDRGQITPGDSKTDVDGQPRTLGKASDLGADELDLLAPRVTITRPRARATLAGRSRLRLAGRAEDPSGVATVVFSLEVLPRAGKTCRWFDPVRALVTRRCSEPVLVRAELAKGGRWSYSGPRRLRLPAGRYRVRVSGTDRAGVDGNTAPAGRRSVTFRVRGAAAAP